MIRFYGSISEDNKKVIIKKERMIFFWAATIPVLLGCCLITIIAINIHLIYLLFLIPLLFFLIIPFFPLSKRSLDLMIPFKISITDNLIISEGNNFKCTKELSDIKKNYRLWYLLFYILNRYILIFQLLLNEYIYQCF